MSTSSRSKQHLLTSPYKYLLIMLIMMMVLPSCSTIAPQPSPTMGIESTGISTATHPPEPSPSPLQVSISEQITPTQPITTLTIEPPAAPDENPQSSDSSLISQGAAFGVLDPYQVEDVAAGQYQPDQADCGSVWLNGMFQESSETLLTLQYTTPLVPDRLEVYAAGMPVNINRIELLNAYSGIGAILNTPTADSWEALIGEEACAKRLTIPVDIDFEVDTVLLEFNDLASAIQIDSVEMLGRLTAFTKPPVYWRVPLPSTPVDIAMGKNGLVYVITQPNKLYAYDVEGNQLSQFSVPQESNITSVTTDQQGNIMVTDAAYDWFILLSPEGEQLSMGTIDFSFPQTAIHPQDGSLYMLSNNRLRSYAVDTAELINEITFDDIHTYTSLTFNAEGQLFTFRDFNWDATLVRIDPLTGEELDAIPLLNSNLNEVVARDIDIDQSGNIYILFAMNTGQVAIHKLSPQGILLQRFGLLLNDPIDWHEGSFLDPAAITVSPDGRFILVADGYDDKSYLSAFLMEIDENPN